MRGWAREAAKDARRRPTTWRGVRWGWYRGGVHGWARVFFPLLYAFVRRQTGWDGDGEIGGPLITVISQASLLCGVGGGMG